MPHQPTVALPVADLTTSVDFYVNKIGFTLIKHQPDADVAQILDSDGDLLLLAGPHAGDITALLAPNHRIIPHGGLIGFFGHDLAAQRDALAQKGISAQLAETRWGNQTLTVPDPDGYRLGFRAIIQRARDETLAFYTGTPDELQAAVAGLSEVDLDLARTPDEWTIRQIVHHIADAETLFMLPMKLALVESGRSFTPNWPSSNTPWAASYAGRPITVALDFIRATRAHIAQIEQHCPDSWDRYVVGDNERQQTFGSFMDTVTNHSLEHIEEIREIRRAHGR